MDSVERGRGDGAGGGEAESRGARLLRDPAQWWLNGNIVDNWQMGGAWGRGRGWNGV